MIVEKDLDKIYDYYGKKLIKFNTFSLLNFFQGQKITLEKIGDFLDYQKKIYGCGTMGKEMFYLDFLDPKKVVPEDKLKVYNSLKEVYVHYIEDIMNLKKKSGKKSIWEILVNNKSLFLNMFFKKILGKSKNEKTILINIEKKQIEFKKNEIIKWLDKNDKKIIEKKGLNFLNEVFKIEKKYYKKINDLMIKLNPHPEGDKPKKRGKPSGSGKQILGSNPYVYLSYLSFELNELILPSPNGVSERNMIMGFNNTKNKNYFYESSEEEDEGDNKEEFFQTSHELQKTVSLLVWFLDGLYGINEIYPQLDTKVLEKWTGKMGDFDEYESYYLKINRKSKRGLLSSGTSLTKHYKNNNGKGFDGNPYETTSNIIFYSIIDFFQKIGYGDNNFKNKLKESKMSILEKTLIAQISVFDLKYLYNGQFIDNIKYFLYSFGSEKYGDEEMKIINSLVNDISNQSFDFEDDENDNDDLGEIEKENNVLDKDYSLGKFKNLIYNFIYWVNKYHTTSEIKKLTGKSPKGYKVLSPQYKKLTVLQKKVQLLAKNKFFKEYSKN